MPETDARKVMESDEKRCENGPEINRIFIQQLIVCEKCVMQNNALKLMMFQ